jgi:hypothetical protein
MVLMHMFHFLISPLLLSFGPLKLTHVFVQHMVALIRTKQNFKF